MYITLWNRSKDLSRSVGHEQASRCTVWIQYLPLSEWVASASNDAEFISLCSICHVSAFPHNHLPLDTYHPATPFDNVSPILAARPINVILMPRLPKILVQVLDKANHHCLISLAMLYLLEVCKVVRRSPWSCPWPWCVPWKRIGVLTPKRIVWFAQGACFNCAWRRQDICQECRQCDGRRLAHLCRAEYSHNEPRLKGNGDRATLAPLR